LCPSRQAVGYAGEQWRRRHEWRHRIAGAACSYMWAFDRSHAERSSLHTSVRAGTSAGLLPSPAGGRRAGDEGVCASVSVDYVQRPSPQPLSRLRGERSEGGEAGFYAVFSHRPKQPVDVPRYEAHLSRIAAKIRERCASCRKPHLRHCGTSKDVCNDERRAWERSTLDS
jgi:hypothetical protein